jgi:Fe-S cluster biogenesis protein NfuA
VPIGSGITKDQVEAVLDTIRPALALDGGNVRLVEIDGNDIQLQLLGACSTCSSGPMTLRHGIEAELRRRLPSLGRIGSVPVATKHSTLP